METPSSTTRRVTRSQTTISAIKSDNVSAIQKIEESKQRALIDITNDSPIVGLAMGKLETPSSLMSKKRANFTNQGKQDNTPGSGEALLRGQVKNMLQKVEEEAIISKVSSVPRTGLLRGHFLVSPNGLLAPTPANTPQIISNPSAINGFENSIGLDSILESQSENEISVPKGEPDKDLMITRSLMLDFSEKSEVSYSSEGSSVVTYEGSQEKDKSEDDSSSIWSIQVNASNKDGHETDEEEIEDETEADYYFDEEKDAENEDAGLVDQLCEGMSKITVNGNGLQPKFCGKRIKFVYNSEDELEGEEVLVNGSNSPDGGLRLQGWPTPKGKHIRFPEEEEAAAAIDD